MHNKEFKVNKYISLILEGNDTFIYVNGERFNQCKSLLLSLNDRYLFEGFSFNITKFILNQIKI